MSGTYIQDLFNECSVGKGVGVKIEEVRAGYARGFLDIGPLHLNVFGSVHGGIVFTLADHVGGACGNSLGTKALLVESSIQYLRPAGPGQRLIAEATLSYAGKRIGRIDIRVHTTDDHPVALMHMVFFRTDDEHQNDAPSHL